MKASELVKRLNELVDTHGDVDIVFESENHYYEIEYNQIIFRSKGNYNGYIILEDEIVIQPCNF